ncbi:hypothetical protein [Mobiluncus porci]|nr:hypothetical protein [Mobiluncus porci]
MGRASARRTTWIRFRFRGMGPWIFLISTVIYLGIWAWQFLTGQDLTNLADGVSLDRNLGGVLKTMATTSSALGEAFRSLAVWFFMWTLVIMSSTRWIEALFAGLDRAAIWHRGVAILGTVSLALHALFTEIGKETTLGKPLATLGGNRYLRARGVGDATAVAELST